MARATLQALCKIEGISAAKAASLQAEARKLVPSFCFEAVPAALAAAREADGHRISTCSSALDDLLGGGVQTGAVVELCGRRMTQLCHTLCVTGQLGVEDGGAEGKALYISTSHQSFRPSNLTAMANRFGLQPHDVLENIVYANAYNSEHLCEMLTGFGAELVGGGPSYALVVVDNASAAFNVDYACPAERWQALARFTRALLRLKDAFGVAVVVTNHGITAPEGLRNVPGEGALGSGCELCTAKGLRWNHPASQHRPAPWTDRVARSLGPFVTGVTIFKWHRRRALLMCLLAAQPEPRAEGASPPLQLQAADQAAGVDDVLHRLAALPEELWRGALFFQFL